MHYRNKYCPRSTGRCCRSHIDKLLFFPTATNKKKHKLSAQPDIRHANLFPSRSTAESQSQISAEEAHNKYGSRNAKRSLFETSNNEVYATSGCISFVIATIRR